MLFIYEIHINIFIFHLNAEKQQQIFEYCRTTVFVRSTNTWYDCRSQTQVMSLLLFSQLERALSASGLAGLDTLFSFMIAAEINVRIRVFFGLFWFIFKSAT